MIDETGVISSGGKTMGQLNIIKKDNGEKRVQLYTPDGIYLCDCGFDGNDDLGFMEIGRAHV